MVVFKVHSAVYTEVIAAKIQPNARARGYFPQSFDRSTPFKWVFVMRTCRCLGVDLLPFFFAVGAFATGASAAVTCRPSDARALSKSTSFGTFSECHRSKNSIVRGQFAEAECDVCITTHPSPPSFHPFPRSPSGHSRTPSSVAHP